MTLMPHFHSPCWILSNPRTGSNYLAEGLSSTGLFNPPIREWLNPQVHSRDHLHCKWQPWLQIRADEVLYRKNVEPLLKALPRNLKIHSFDYHLYFDWSHKHAIIDRLKNIRFITKTYFLICQDFRKCLLSWGFPQDWPKITHQ